MKELIVGDIAVYSEDGDSWEDLIEVVKKVNKAYMDWILEPDKEEKKSLIQKLKKKFKIKKPLF